MSQVSVSSTTASGRSSLHALRPVLVLGGFVAIWWALMTGVAHADSTPHHLLDSVGSQVKAHHETPVRDLVRRVHHDVKATTTRTTDQVRHQAKPVTHTVAATVDSTPLAPVTTKVTKTVRTTVSDTVAKTRSLLAKTAAGPVLDIVDGTVKTTVENAESSTLQGNSHFEGTVTKALGKQLSETSATTSASTVKPSGGSVGTHRKLASDDAGAPVDSPRGLPPVSDPCATPSGSSSISFAPVGITESSWLGTPSVLRDHRSWRLARLPGGPAYQPGCSPD
jgi:hypothetical protein